jgi:hypothetical protein
MFLVFLPNPGLISILSHASNMPRPPHPHLSPNSTSPFNVIHLSVSVSPNFRKWIFTDLIFTSHIVNSKPYRNWLQPSHKNHSNRRCLGDVATLVYLCPSSIICCDCHSHPPIGKHPSLLVYSARGNDIVLRRHTHTHTPSGDVVLVYFVSGFMPCYRCWVCKRKSGV